MSFFLPVFSFVCFCVCARRARKRKRKRGRDGVGSGCGCGASEICMCTDGARRARLDWNRTRAFRSRRSNGGRWRAGEDMGTRRGAWGRWGDRPGHPPRSTGAGDSTSTGGDKTRAPTPQRTSNDLSRCANDMGCGRARHDGVVFARRMPGRWGARRHWRSQSWRARTKPELGLMQARLRLTRSKAES